MRGPENGDLEKREASLQVGIAMHFAVRHLPSPANFERCGHWLSEGIAEMPILKAVEAVLARGKAVFTLDYFDGAVRYAHA